MSGATYMSHPFWLANRDKSIADNSGVLGIDGSGKYETHLLWW